MIIKYRNCCKTTFWPTLIQMPHQVSICWPNRLSFPHKIRAPSHLIINVELHALLHVWKDKLTVWLSFYYSTNVHVHNSHTYNYWQTDLAILSKMHGIIIPRCMEYRRGLAMRILSVRPSVRPSVGPSVCQTRALRQNGEKISPDFYTIQKII